MIVFDLECRLGGHRFEGWFGSSDDFAAQQTRGLVSCPQCGSGDVGKAPMAPNIGRKGNQLESGKAILPSQPSTMADNAPIVPMSTGKLPPEALKMMQAMAAMQAEALRQSRWVGDKFADKARAMHYGESNAEAIHGQTTLEEAQDLLDEGIDVAPLPFPVAPPPETH
jgi:hypothetical protein